MKIQKTYSHKKGEEILKRDKPEIIQEIESAIHNINALDCLTKESLEKSKARRWGGLLFSPRVINAYFRNELLLPGGWLVLNENTKKYGEHTVLFTSQNGAIEDEGRQRKIDGIKDQIGLEIQFGKYAFMGYDVFSKMIIFKKIGRIVYGIEIVLMQEMSNCMSTGVSAFEHLMIDFKYRGEADIDIPILVIGVASTEEEWDAVFERQPLYKKDPITTRAMYPQIGLSDLKGNHPGPK